KMPTITLLLLSSILIEDAKKPQITEFVLLGGWRLTAEFARGGMAIDHTGKKLYLVGHAERDEVYEYELPEMGPGQDPQQWPALKPVRVIPGWWQDGYANSLAYHEGKLWAAIRKFYDTSPPKTLTLFASDGSQKEINLPRQQFSGFVKSAGKFPELGCGGYESGQGSAFGPTLATIEGKALIYHDFNADWKSREKREPNYYPVERKDCWTALEPREIQGKLEGRWACDRVYGGGVRLPSGIYFWPYMGIGDIDYARQSTTFAAKDQTYLYQYDPTNYALIGWKALPELGLITGHEVSPDGKLIYLVEGNVWKSGLYQVDP
ncbi:MAG TPA: hypothetical protein PKA06_10275, partial [Gemmatales bacterium]|nr:hypothetical protein [Gemmatales bacterium]